MWTNCRARLGSMVFQRYQLFRVSLCFRFDAVQKTKKIENNLNELSGSPGKRSFVALLTLLETRYLLTWCRDCRPKRSIKLNRISIFRIINITIYVLRLDAVQKTMKTESIWTNCRAHPGDAKFCPFCTEIAKFAIKFWQNLSRNPWDSQSLSEILN